MYTHPSTAANLPCLPGSSDKYCVLTSLVPPVHNQGVSSAPNQGHMPYGKYSCRLLAHSLYVLLLTFSLPAAALFSGRFPVAFRFFISSYRGWSQHSSILFSNAQTNHDILFSDIFMLPLQFAALRYHSASS